jgi:hypothetical protein
MDLLNQEKLIDQLKYIKIGLSSGTDLHIELGIDNPYELLKLSELAIYCVNNRLIFKINIPLLYQNIFSLY